MVDRSVNCTAEPAGTEVGVALKSVTGVTGGLHVPPVAVQVDFHPMPVVAASDVKRRVMAPLLAVTVPGEVAL